MKETDKNFPIPGGSSILVLKETDEKKTKAGIILTDLNPDVNQGVQHKFTGIIKAVGCECKRQFKDSNTGISRTLEIGDRVIYNSYANMRINHEGVDYLIMGDIDAYCLLPSLETLTSSQEQKKGQRPNINQDEFKRAISQD